jgi:hypothetical protein
MGVKTILDVDRRVKKVFVMLNRDEVTWIIAFFEATGVKKIAKGKYVVLNSGEPRGLAINIDELKETWEEIW